MGLFDSILNGVGLESSNLNYMARKKPKIATKKQINYNNFNLHQKKEEVTRPINTDSSSLVVFAPKNHSDVQKVITTIKKKEACLCNLYNLEETSAERVLDFLSGGVFALDGSISRIQGHLFLITPYGINVKMGR